MFHKEKRSTNTLIITIIIIIIIINSLSENADVESMLLQTEDEKQTVTFCRLCRNEAV